MSQLRRTLALILLAIITALLGLGTAGVASATTSTVTVTVDDGIRCC